MPIFGIEFFVSSYFNFGLFSWNIRFSHLIAVYCTLIFRKCLFDYSIFVHSTYSKNENFDRSSDINALMPPVWWKIDVYLKNIMNSSTIKSWCMQIKPSKSRRVELMSLRNFLDIGYDLFRYHATVKWWKPDQLPKDLIQINSMSIWNRLMNIEVQLHKVWDAWSFATKFMIENFNE